MKKHGFSPMSFLAQWRPKVGALLSGLFGAAGSYQGSVCSDFHKSTGHQVGRLYR